MAGKRRFEAFLTDVAETDLEEIIDFIEMKESPERAELVFDRLKGVILALESSPTRGRVVPELRRVGVTEYRELLQRPYRVIYYVVEQKVHVVGIFDGRRDLEDILSDRLLR